MLDNTQSSKLRVIRLYPLVEYNAPGTNLVRAKHADSTLATFHSLRVACPSSSLLHRLGRPLHPLSNAFDYHEKNDLLRDVYKIMLRIGLLRNQ